MQIPMRLHYAVLAMMELAAAEGRSEPMSIRHIASRHAIPQPFLVQILQQLKARGWVASSRGSSGGYRLGANMSGLTLGDIADAIGCGEAGCRTEGGGTLAAEELKRVWDRAAQAYRDVLESVTLADLIEHAEEGQSAMFYI